MQLVGWRTVIWGLIAGFAIYGPLAPLVVIAGIFLPLFSSASILRYWEHREDELNGKPSSIDK